MIYGLLSIDGIGMIITLYGFFGCREAFFFITVSRRAARCG